MKHTLIAAGVICALNAWPTGHANAQESVPTPTPPAKAASASAASPGVIVPLSPPETLNGPQIEKKPVFGNFQYDSGLPEKSLDVTVRSMFEDYRLSGPGRGQSFYDPGSHWLHDVELTARQPIGEELKTEFNAIVRYTDSKRHDPAVWSLQRVQFIARDQVNHLTLGDYYATLSQYSLNQAIKGIGYQRNFGESTYLRVVAGTMAPRWDHLFGEPHNETIQRDVVGLRAQNAGDNYRVGLNLVSAADHDNDSARTIEDTYRQVLPAFDWEYRTASGIRLSGEHAQANTRKQTAARVNHDMAGTAHRINADGSLGDLRWRLRTERVSSDFVTLGGGAAIDRLRYYLRGDYRLNKTWSVFLADDWYRDNLDDQIGATTRTHIPEAGVTARGLFDRRNLTLTTSLRQRQVKTEAPLYDRNISDRLYVSMSDRFQEVSVRGEVEALLNKRKDTTNNRTDTDDFLYRFAIDSRHLFAEGRYDFRPYLTLEHQIVQDPLTGKSVLTDGALLDLRLVAPGNLTYAMNFEQRNVNNGTGIDNDNSLLRYAVSVAYRPAQFPGSSIRAEAGKTHYNFSDNTKDYRERYVRVMLDIPFSLEK